jgi:hypothetical protein
MFVMNDHDVGNLDRLRDAAKVLVGPGAVKQRLCEAFTRHVQGLDESQLPRPLVPELRAILDAHSTASAVGGLNAVEVTIRKMSEQDAGLNAERILDLYLALSQFAADELLASRPRPLRLVRDE